MKKIDIDVNNFPSLTWNFLKINRTSLDASLSSGCSLKVSGGISVVEKVLSEEEKGLFCGIRTGLGEKFDAETDSFAAETGSSMNYVGIADGSVVSGRISVEPGKGFADFIVDAGCGSRSEIVLSASDSVVRVRVNAAENAFVRIVFVNLGGKDSVTVFSLGSVCGDSAHIEVTELELGGKKVYSGIHNILSGYKARYTGHTAYIVDDGSFLDMNQVSLQTGRGTESRFWTDGVVMGKGAKTWRGTIDFKKGCVDAKGDEQENVLLLSPEVINKSLPVILCDEEAVEGRHGCSIGRLDMDKLFYMQSRGIDFDTAKSLMIKSKVYAVAKFIDDKDTVAEIEDFIEGNV